jgi:hypothetical protein
MNLTPIDFKAVAAKGYYLYAYLRQDDLTPYYIGLSCNYRRPLDPDHCVDVPDDICRIRVLRSALTKEEAEAWEQFYIFWFGRKSEGGCLRNLRAGGSTGSTGYKHTAATKSKFAARVWSEETNAKRSAAQKGRPITKAHAAKISAANAANAKERTALSAQMRRINTAQRLEVCPLLWGTLSKKEQTKARMRVHRGATGEAIFHGFFPT